VIGCVRNSVLRYGEDFRKRNCKDFYVGPTLGLKQPTINTRKKAILLIMFKEREFVSTILNINTSCSQQILN
jgi:hypothetical protein